MDSFNLGCAFVSRSSLGLAIPPRVRFLQRAAKRRDEHELLKQGKNSEDLESNKKTGKQISQRLGAPLRLSLISLMFSCIVRCALRVDSVTEAVEINN